MKRKRVEAAPTESSTDSKLKLLITASKLIQVAQKNVLWKVKFIVPSTLFKQKEWPQPVKKGKPAVLFGKKTKETTVQNIYQIRQSSAQQGKGKQ